LIDEYPFGEKMAQEQKILGVVNAIGIERDEQEYQNFTLIIGIKIKTDKKISYNEGEKIIKTMQKSLLGKNIELEAIAVPCPICSKTFNSEQGMKQHKRLAHDGVKTPKKKRIRKKKTTNTQKKTSSKKKSRSKK
jgi:hypothetical protein